MRYVVYFWSTYLRVFADKGRTKPENSYSLRRLPYGASWGMWGFIIILGGKQIFFSFGKDKNKLYKNMDKFIKNGGKKS